MQFVISKNDRQYYYKLKLNFKLTINLNHILNDLTKTSLYLDEMISLDISNSKHLNRHYYYKLKSYFVNLSHILNDCERSLNLDEMMSLDLM